MLHKTRAERPSPLIKPQLHNRIDQLRDFQSQPSSPITVERPSYGEGVGVIRGSGNENGVEKREKREDEKRWSEVAMGYRHRWREDAHTSDCSGGGGALGSFTDSGERNLSKSVSANGRRTESATPAVTEPETESGAGTTEAQATPTPSNALPAFIQLASNNNGSGGATVELQERLEFLGEASRNHMWDSPPSSPQILPNGRDKAPQHLRVNSPHSSHSFHSLRSQISLHSLRSIASRQTPLPSAPSTPTSMESASGSSMHSPPNWDAASPGFGKRGTKVLNGRLVKSKPKSTQTQPRSLPPSALGSPSPLVGEYHKEKDRSERMNAKEPREKVEKEKSSGGNKIWKLMKRISTPGLRDKYTAMHTPSPSLSMASDDHRHHPQSQSLSRSLSRAATQPTTGPENYSEESLSASPLCSSHQSHGSYGSYGSHGSHGSLGGSSSAFHHEHAPPVPAIPKDLQTPNLLLPVASSPSSPSLANESAPNTPKKHHKRDKVSSRSTSSPIPSSPSPLSSDFHSSTNSTTSPSSTTSNAPAQVKKRILSRISSVGILRRKPSIASGLTPSFGFGAAQNGTVDKTDGANMDATASVANGDSSVPEVPQIPFIPPSMPSTPTAPSTPLDTQTASTPTKPSKSKSKSTKYSISCIPIPSIPSMSSTPSIPIISSTPSTPIKSSIQLSSSRPGASKTLSSATSSSSPRVSFESHSVGFLNDDINRKRSNRSLSRSNSMDSLGRKRGNSNHQHRNNTIPQSATATTNPNTAPISIHATTTNSTTSRPYPLAKHIVPPLELLATLSADGWGVEHVLSGEDDDASGTGTGTGATNSSVSLPIGHNGFSPPPTLNRAALKSPPKNHNRNNTRGFNRSTTSLDKLDKLDRVNKWEKAVDKWERLERVGKWNKSELDKLDGLRSRSAGNGGGGYGGGESWSIVRSPEDEELPSLPVPPRKRTKEGEREREKEKTREKGKASFKDEKVERSASVEIVISPVSSSPVYRGRIIANEAPALSTFGRVMGRQISTERMEEKLLQQPSPAIQGRASCSAVGEDRDNSREDGRDQSRGRRSLSAVRSASSVISSLSSSSIKDSQSNLAVPSPRSWRKSLSTPTSPFSTRPSGELAKQQEQQTPTASTPSEITENTDAVTSTSTMAFPTVAAAATTSPPRALGTLLRKLSFTGGSSSPAGGNERRHKSSGRPSISSIPSVKARSASMSGDRSGLWNPTGDKQGDLEPPLPHPRKLLRKNSLKGRNNGSDGNYHDKDGVRAVPVVMRARRPRTADASTSSNNSNGLTEEEKRKRWASLLEKSEKAGGTIHLRANGEGLLSDTMRMSMVSTASGTSGSQVGAKEGE